MQEKGPAGCARGDDEEKMSEQEAIDDDDAWAAAGLS